MFNKSKKAFIETQFNWIFIIIAGGFILLFFFSVVNKQKQVSDIKITETIKSDLRAILTGSKVSTGTASLIGTPDLEIKCDCQGYSIGKLSPIKQGAGFSPSLIKGYSLMAWALDWNMPFRVTNFLYLTSPQMRYIIVNDTDGFAEQLNATLPPKTIVQDKKTKILMNKEFVSDLSNIQDKNNYKVRFVFFNHDPIGTEGISNLDSMKDKDVTAVNIIPSSGFDSYGELRFFEKSNGIWSQVVPNPITHYIGKASLVGAVFTDDIEIYNCNMKRAFKDLSIISEIYINRTGVLAEFYGASFDVPCQTQIGVSIIPLETIRDNADSISNSFSMNPGLLGEMSQAVYNLINYNAQTQRLSCEEIY